MLRQLSARTARWTLIRPQCGIVRPQARRALTVTAEQTGKAAEEEVLLYTAPFERPVLKLRRFSFISCILTTIGTPALAILAKQYTGEDPGKTKLAAVGLVMCFGFFSTGLLHLMMKPYVTRLWLLTRRAVDGQMQQRLKVETTTLTGRKRLA